MGPSLCCWHNATYIAIAQWIQPNSANIYEVVQATGGGRITFAEQSWVENDLRVQKGNSIMRWWWTTLVLKMPMIYSGRKIGPQRKFGSEPKKNNVFFLSLSVLFCLYFMGSQCICYKHTVEMWSQRWLLNWCVDQDQAQPPSPGPGDPPWPSFCPPFLPPILQLSAFHLSSAVELHHTVPHLCSKRSLGLKHPLLFFTMRQVGGPSPPGKLG